MSWYQHFFQIGPIPADAIYGWYDPTLVVLSYIIAAFASYVALDMSAHLKKQSTFLFRICWWIGGAVVMGAGIWSMHFVGMLAFHMDMPMTYDLIWTGLSMLIAVIAAAIAFIFFMKPKPKTIHYVLSGIILGTAILAMHYTGMAGMNDMYIHYKIGLFMLSVVVAVVASTAAVWLSAYSNTGKYSRRVMLKIISALIMGLAIVGMHYIGMAAAIFTPMENMVHETGAGLAADQTLLAILIATIVLCIMSIAVILSTTKYYVSSKVQNEKDFLEIVLNNLRGGVIAFDSNKKLSLYNDATTDWFNGIADFKGSILDWENTLPLFKIGNKSKLNFQEYPVNIIFDGKKVKNAEALVQDIRGKERVLSIDGQLLVGREGEKLGAVLVYQDITERKQIDQMKNEFISTVSHELRTPLTSIRGSLGLIMGGAMGEIPNKMFSLLEIACNNSERLVRLINDILDTEKIESGKMIFHFSKTDLSKIVEQEVISNQPYADKYKVSFKVDKLLPGVCANIDPDRIRQVMDNLLSNAAKFSKSGGEVSIAMEKDKGHIRVSIADKGNGIPLEFQSRIFSKFYQADSSDIREKGGTGLGLSICKSIVEAHKGRIWFNSSPAGSTFYFELPEMVTLGQDTALVENSKGSKQILICEDDQDVGKLLSMMLMERGYTTLRVDSIAGAKKALAENNFCLMTLDLLLPDGNGLELLKWVRTQNGFANLPVIVISAISIEQEKVKGNTLGVVDWINKPIDEQQLYKDVARALGTKKPGVKSRVLHIEDDPDLGKIVSALITNISDTDVADTVATAKKMLQNFKYNLIILDLNLKDGTGYDVLAFLEENAFRIPVIILSVDEPLMNVSKNIAASMVKSKVSNKDLLEKIVSVIEKNQPSSEVKDV